MKIIQIRGNNGTGKTTIVREFLNKHGSDIVSVRVGKRLIECHKVGNIIVIGRYDKNVCGGCDAAIRTAEELKDTIAKLIRTFKPEALIFEGVMYGKSFNLTWEFYNFAKAVRAEFLAICLEPDFETSLARIYKRNGGKEVNVNGLASGWRGSLKSNAKLRARGVPTKTYDTAKMTIEDMGRVLEEVLNER